uniref:Myb-like domain-containing protein n=1 Tax=Noccaea caerulescens TaxID=107243 RepID=A0A1J3HHK8_NOCCA
MTTFNKKRIRISSPGSNSDDEDERNPRTHENGINGDACRETSLKSNTCFVCDGNDNWVLLCHGEECPIAIHQRCISDEPDFDEFGNFYCPYCWYKRVVVKSLKLRKKIDKSRKSRETLGGGVDLGLKIDQVSEDIENVVEVNVTGGRRRMISTSVDSRREIDESYEKFMAMEKNQRMKEVAGDTQSREVSEAGDDDVNQEGSNAFISNASERRKGRARGSEGRRCCHEKNQQQQASSTESCGQEVTRTDKRGPHGSGSREGRCGEKNQHTKTVEIENQDKKVSKDWERKRGGAVERDGDEFYLAEDQERQPQADMRNDYATFSEQENGFRKDEEIERKSVSSTDNVNDSNAASQELGLIIQPKAGVQQRPIAARPFRSVPPNNPSFQPESSGHQSDMEKNGAASNDPGQRRYAPCGDRKRKRILWTQAEEEMLRVGVQKFPGFRNIPWRKILEYGRDVFQEERVPSDLKDKWKNMHKMSSGTGKWVSLSTERQPNHSAFE